MPIPYKPDGYTSVAPYLTVEGAQSTIDFLKQVVGAVELRRHDGDGGKIAHAEVRIDDTVLMLADSMPQWPATSTSVHIYVPDVDATYAKAIAVGGVSVQEPIQKGDPDRRCGVRDAGGTTWWFATMVG
jgi:PhnB protein